LVNDLLQIGYSPALPSLSVGASSFNLKNYSFFAIFLFPYMKTKRAASARTKQNLLTVRIVVYTIILKGVGSMERKDESLQAKAALIVEECIAVKLRLLSRAVTKIYNRALRPYGLTVSQMNILVAVSYIGQAKQQDICQALHLEKSTLSRDLARMRERGWVAESPGDDGRSSLLRVTAHGEKLLQRAFPAWRQAQQQAAELLGERDIAALGRAAKTLRSSRTKGLN
jgi:DNA-binding MarR family transcriptional regulator